MRPDAVPTVVADSGSGYVRWTPVRGATGYDVWFVNRNKIVSTTTTVADLRDYFSAGAPTKAIWRVRADRRYYGPANAGMPAISYGPWSQANTASVAVNPSAHLATVSQRVGQNQARTEHRLMPVFIFPAKDGNTFHHVYVASDAACTDVVYNSAIVRGSAFAPRAAQIAMGSGAAVAVNDGPVFTKGGSAVRPSEAPSSADPKAWAHIDLPDTAARNGAYTWTVVPVERRANGSYHDLESVKDACRAAKASFSKTSPEPLLGGRTAPFVTGLSPIGNLFAPAKAPGRFYGYPVIAWKPASGATQYEIQWSHARSPWRPAGTLKTYATSATLPLKPGSWWYRVRGLNDSAVGSPQLRWSVVQRMQITIPIFSVQRS
jgi:hypothetical protein